MKFVCRHCGGTAFRLLTGTDGRSAAECLKCGRASSFDQSNPANPIVPLGKSESDPAAE